MMHQSTSCQRIFCLFLIVCAVCLISPQQSARADFLDIWDKDAPSYYTIYEENGRILTYVSGTVYEEDEYISTQNALYQIISVDNTSYRAVAAYRGDIALPVAEYSADAALPAAQQDEDKRIAMYVTHSDESYEPTDGTSSDEEWGGIYDVLDALAAELQELGITAEIDYSTHLPHDSGAYRRSRQTAVELLKTMPDAILDIHRDGIPAEEYESQVNGEKVSMVRLLVGRSNPNQAANKEFAQKLKAVGDEMYPGLIKDIYIGKGSYNQELSPRSVLLEFGTHENEKELPLNSTKYMAQVLSQTIYGEVAMPSQSDPSASQSPQQLSTQEPMEKDNRGAGSGIFWILGIAILGGLIFLLYSRGEKEFGKNVGRTVSEMTGGLLGKKPSDSDEENLRKK